MFSVEARVRELDARLEHAGGNIIDVSHHRDLPGVPLKDAVLEVSLETRDRAHAEAELGIRQFDRRAPVRLRRRQGRIVPGR